MLGIRNSLYKVFFLMLKMEPLFFMSECYDNHKCFTSHIGRMEGQGLPIRYSKLS